MPYGWTVVVVAALAEGQNWEPFVDFEKGFEKGFEKKALIGTVLGPGDPAYDALHGQPVPRNRTAFEYVPDDERGLADVDAGPATTRPATGQGRQMDPVLRQQVEDAAQDRLMDHYRAGGWEVTDTRFTRPYDAMARRGRDVVYLEAKGTQTAGDAVLLTTGEVEHVRTHPGRCVMGVLSDIRLDEHGQVDPTSGTF